MVKKRHLYLYATNLFTIGLNVAVLLLKYKCYSWYLFSLGKNKGPLTAGNSIPVQNLVSDKLWHIFYPVWRESKLLQNED